MRSSCSTCPGPRTDSELTAQPSSAIPEALGGAPAAVATRRRPPSLHIAPFFHPP